MNTPTKNIHGNWSSPLIFILAAAGSAVGLGNIWKFPYMAGANGGSAFVLVYLVCIFLIGFPLLIAEILLGRRGQASPINSIIALARESKASKNWGIIGWLGSIAGFLVTAYYVIIAGWAVRYMFRAFTGVWVGQDALTIADEFTLFQEDGLSLLLWGWGFLAVTMFFVGRGVRRGLETVVRYLMPLLIILLLGLLAYAMTTGYLGEAAAFLFQFDQTKLTSEVVLKAVGHAFFTLSLGMGAIMVYGSYMPKNASIGKSAFMIVMVDTLVALVAGLVIFTVVFSNGLDTDSGPGLLFKTLPIAFGQIQGGAIIGGLFFMFVCFAALTSSISLIEPFVAWIVEKGFSRPMAALIVGLICWLFSIGAALSFNEWADVKFFKGTIIDNMFFITDNVLLPLGGVLMAVFVGWVMKDTKVRKELIPKYEWAYILLRIVLRWVAPIAVLYVMADGFGLIDWLQGQFADLT